MLPVDLQSLAAQLPDLSHLDNFTVNIQTNTFAQPPENSHHFNALAQETEARLGNIRSELK
jgi:hypothetical protein